MPVMGHNDDLVVGEFPFEQLGYSVAMIGINRVENIIQDQDLEALVLGCLAPSYCEEIAKAQCVQMGQRYSAEADVHLCRKSALRG